ncbi:VOC family protein [Streptomyces sp. TRM70350]|uniref:VOC family protein n=1 Tax=Streptomyces sp. TRM70350 TaxID=2856165 RepID=UPI001C461058|nr:VOC family protein [Streptomyces sp. TRM70350]MBV7699423.1 VOC family protein [Streptomyces sp. TRM70350]
MSSAPLIHHVALLVPNLEAAISEWSAATGYTFSEIARYRTDRYCDKSNPEPHHHDARISFSKEGPPFIELMEFHGSGTHSIAQGEGFHHLGFLDHPDPEGRLADLAALGIEDDGMALAPDNSILLWFTSKKHLNGMRLEYVSTAPQPIVKDDGSEPYRNIRGCPVLWPPEQT